MKAIVGFVKKEIILVIALALAAVSAIFVPPGAAYLSYIDFSVLGILFCLMTVVAGLMKLGVFEAISARLITRSRNTRFLTFILVNCVFFSSMLFTNDVALIAFVPVTIGIFGIVGREKLISAIVIETLAANLGSMLTPIGNPQNLYIYSFYGMNVADFFRIVLPVGAFGYAILLCATLSLRNGGIQVTAERRAVLQGRTPLLAYYAGLFLLCVLAVLRVIDYRLCALVVLACTLIVDRALLKRVDYGLLLTFVAFFVLVGNIEQSGAVKAAFSNFLAGRVLLAGVLSSQVISNVPAAMMVSRFTNDARNLLLGVNIGGLGTPVASLASLISLKLYSKSENASTGRYLAVFSMYNIAALILLVCIATFVL